MEILKTIGLVVALGLTFTPPQSTEEFLHQLVGQHLILRHYTGSSHPEGNRRDLSPARRECDVAVEVTAVALDKSSIRLQVRNIGTPNVVNKSGTIEGCANVDVISFQINGFDVDQPRDQAEKKIGYALQTPETYLAALGIPWNATSSSENEPPVSLSRPGVKAGKALLIVNPYYPEASRKGHSGGKVIVNCVIGTDGIVHNAIIEKGATKELNELALDVLTFYRFQPAYDGDHAVAVKVPFEFSFQPY